jgi:hypothetical protein
LQLVNPEHAIDVSSSRLTTVTSHVPDEPQFVQAGHDGTPQQRPSMQCVLEHSGSRVQGLPSGHVPSTEHEPVGLVLASDIAAAADACPSESREDDASPAWKAGPPCEASLAIAASELASNAGPAQAVPPALASALNAPTPNRAE